MPVESPNSQDAKVLAGISVVEVSQGNQIEWTTLLLCSAIYLMWIAITLFHSQIPDLLLAALGGWAVAWHSSFQHEVIHGHPTPWRSFNKALAIPPLSLWLPFEIYRESHLRHHNDETLTDPLEDPESKYLSAKQWNELTAFGKAIHLCQVTLMGRMMFGPAVLVLKFFRDELTAACAGDFSRARIWILHLLYVALLAIWLVVVCKMSLIKYIALFVYPSLALLALRSFAEHRAAEAVNQRTAIVEDESLLSLLFLNNNLHAVHHRDPAIAWYLLPDLYSQNRDSYIRDNGGLVYKGYADIVRKFATAPHDQLIHENSEEGGFSSYRNYSLSEAGS